jgi:dephospho-CoA kinase
MPLKMAVESRGLYFNESHRKLLTLSAGHFKVAKSDFVTILRFVPNPYRSIMKVYGLTGGIGSGKTTIRQLIESLGILTLDADAIGRELVAPNQPGLVKIVQAFGSDVLTEQGELNRAALRQRILEDPDAKHKLEAILHPMIRERTQAAIEQLRRQNPPAIVVEIPLLAETGKPDYIDETIVLDLPEAMQLQRALQRGTLPEADIRRLMENQASREARLAIADHVIRTDQPLERIKQTLQTLLEDRN